MSYYGAGDYYGAGGILSSIGGALKKVAGVGLTLAASAIPGGSSVLNVGRTIVSSGGNGGLVRPPLINLPGSGLPGMGIGPIGTQAHMASRLDPRFYTKDGRPRRIRKDGQPWKRPTMDPGNTRALRRAARRSDRFVSIARTALANTKWKVASRSSGGRTRGKK